MVYGDDDTGCSQVNSAVIEEFEEAVLGGDDAETGLAMEFGQYATFIDRDVGDVYDVFKERLPEAGRGVGDVNFNRFCDDLDVLVAAGIIEPLEEAATFYHNPNPKFKKQQQIVATEHGQGVVSPYLENNPL